MPQNTLIATATAAVCVVLTSQAVFADDYITFKYDAIYDKIQDMQTKLQTLTDLHPVLKISSASCGVKFSDVTLELQSKGTTPVTLSIDKLGQVSFPVESKLYKSGYSVISNQQHGLTYDVKMGLTVSGLNLSYKDLAKLEADFRQGLRSVGGFIAYHVMIPQGLVFVYTDGSPSIVISSQKGDQTTVAQPANGYHGLPDGMSIIKLPIDQQSDDLNEKINLQRLPDSVDVMFTPDIEQIVTEQYASDASACKAK